MTSRVLQTIGVAAIAALLLVSGCKISKQGSGGDDKVSIEAPGASVNVDTGRTTNDTGIALYPGAQEKHSKDEDKDRAHVSVDTPFVKVKVVALNFTSADAPEKVLAFYRTKLEAFGSVVQCDGTSDPIGLEGHKNLDSPVRCGSEHHGHGEISLKSGTEGNQHVVIVKPSGSGSEFSLVYFHLGNAKTEDDYSGKQPS